MKIKLSLWNKTAKNTRLLIERNGTGTIEPKPKLDKKSTSNLVGKNVSWGVAKYLWLLTHKCKKAVETIDKPSYEVQRGS